MSPVSLPSFKPRGNSVLYYQSKEIENVGFEASVNGVIVIQSFVKIGKLTHQWKLSGLQENKNRKRIP